MWINLYTFYIVLLALLEPSFTSAPYGDLNNGLTSPWTFIQDISLYSESSLSLEVQYSRLGLQESYNSALCASISLYCTLRDKERSEVHCGLLGSPTKGGFNFTHLYLVTEHVLSHPTSRIKTLKPRLPQSNLPSYGKLLWETKYTKTFGFQLFYSYDVKVIVRNNWGNPINFRTTFRNYTIHCDSFIHKTWVNVKIITQPNVKISGTMHRRHGDPPKGERLQFTSLPKGDPTKLLIWRNKIEDKFDKIDKTNIYNMRDLPFNRWVANSQSFISEKVDILRLEDYENFNDFAEQGKFPDTPIKGLELNHGSKGIAKFTPSLNDFIIKPGERVEKSENLTAEEVEENALKTSTPVKKQEKTSNQVSSSLSKSVSLPEFEAVSVKNLSQKFERSISEHSSFSVINSKPSQVSFTVISEIYRAYLKLEETDPESLTQQEKDKLAENRTKKKPAKRKRLVFRLRKGMKNGDDKTVSEDDERKVLRALLTWTSGNESSANAILNLGVSKGGVYEIEHYFGHENQSRLLAAYQQGTRILFRFCPSGHKSPLIQGKDWKSWNDYVDSLFIMKNCFIETPAFSMIRGLIKEIMNDRFNKKVNKRNLNKIQAKIKVEISYYVESLGIMANQMCMDWSKVDLKDNNGRKGVNVDLYESGRNCSLFAEQDKVGPAFSMFIMAVVMSILPDHICMGALRDLAMKEKKEVFELGVPDILHNKVRILNQSHLNYQKSINFYNNFQFVFMERANHLAKRKGTFDFEKWSSDMAIKFNHMALNSDQKFETSYRFSEMKEELNDEQETSTQKAVEYDSCDSDDAEAMQEILLRRMGNKKLDPNLRKKYNDMKKKLPEWKKKPQRQNPPKGQQDIRKSLGKIQNSIIRTKSNLEKYGQKSTNKKLKKIEKGRNFQNKFRVFKAEGGKSILFDKTSGKNLRKTCINDRVSDTFYEEKSSEEDEQEVSVSEDEKPESDNYESEDQYSGTAMAIIFLISYLTIFILITINSDIVLAETKRLASKAVYEFGDVRGHYFIENCDYEKITLNFRSLMSDPFRRGACPTVHLSPINFKNRNKDLNYRMIIDSGAQQSLIPVSLLKHIDPKCVLARYKHPFERNIDASGSDMKMSEYAYDIDLKIEESDTIVMKLRGAVVLLSTNKNVDRQILLGNSDMQEPNYICLKNVRGCKRTKILVDEVPLDYKTICTNVNQGRITKLGEDDKLELQNLDFDRRNDFENENLGDFNWSMKHSKSKSAASFEEIYSHFENEKPYEKQFYRATKKYDLNKDLGLWCEENRIDPYKPVKILSRKHDPDNWETRAVTGDGNMRIGYTYDRVKSPFCPDSEYKTYCDIERIRKSNLETFTHQDVVIDPENEVLKNDPKKLEKIKILRNLLEKYKDVFRSDTGCVTTGDFKVHAEIDLENSEFSSNKAVSYLDRQPPQYRQAMCDKFNKELADGVLKRCIRSDIILKNIMPTFAVAKKGGCLDVNVESAKIRLIADCSRTINSNTIHKGRQGDDIREITRNVSKFTQNGFLFAMDISDCFHCIRLDPSLYPYFGIQHPDLGDCYYTRLPQGWISSPGFCKDFLLNLLGKYSDKLCRYADDVLGGGDNWTDFVETLEGVLATLKYNNLRLKGKKVQLLGYSAEFLGRRVERGVIKPSQHHISRIADFDHTKIHTKRQLKQFNGLITYLAEFKKMAAEAFYKIRKLAEGPNSDKINWTEDNIKTFEEVKKEMDNLCFLHTLDPKLQTILTTDTSKHATGAILYQKKKLESGLWERRVIGLFSRKRSDLDNKRAIASCVLELSGIAAAVAHFRPYLERLETKLVIRTDSQGAQRAFNKFKRCGVPSNNMRLTSFLNAVWGLNFTLDHVSSDNQEIESVDFLSRYNADYNLPACSGDCSICKIVADVQGSDALGIISNRITQEFAKIKYEDDCMLDMDVNTYLKHDPENPEIKNVVRKFSNDFLWKSNEIRLKINKTNTQCRKKEYVDYTGPIFDLLNNHKLLNMMQNSCSDLREAKKIIARNLKGKLVDPPTNKRSSIRTLVKNSSAKLDNYKILRVKKTITRDKSIRMFDVIVLPKWYGRTIIESLHTSYGDMTLTQIMKKADQIVSIKGLKEIAEKFVKECPGCMLLKRQGANPRNWSYKAAPIPDKIGEMILVDEVHRMDTKNKTVRFLYATDSLSRFSKLYYINTKRYTYQEVMELLKKVKRDFDRPDLQNKVIYRMDHSRPHLKISKQKKFLDDYNIEIVMHDKHTAMSVGLPELDGRLHKMSYIISRNLAVPSHDMEKVASLSTKQFNETIGQENFAPIEIWTGKSLSTHKPIEIPIKLLKETMNEIRKSHRDDFDEKLKTTRNSKKLHFIKYEPGMSYSENTGTPLKEGDLVLLTATWDKNQKSRFWRISKSKNGERAAINWDERLIHAYKLGVKPTESNGKLLSFEGIAWVIDGHSTQARSFEKELERNPEFGYDKRISKELFSKFIGNTEKDFDCSSRRVIVDKPYNDPFYDHEILELEDYFTKIESYDGDIRKWDKCHRLIDNGIVKNPR